uniref:Uncharacterized protein n=1 Tax=Populus trichocarpa TaxID=3694 RepID=A0A3N7EBA5_POPTR
MARQNPTAWSDQARFILNGQPQIGHLFFSFHAFLNPLWLSLVVGWLDFLVSANEMARNLELGASSFCHILS